MLKRKWRVRLTNVDGSWWISLQLLVDVEPDEWMTWWDGMPVSWRLTPSLLDGLYVVPALWFKPLKEAKRLAGELNETATKMFEEALSKAVKAREVR